ncbi:hypothetical protein WDW89_14835 [Deltaproteobacteria bacterium TL4]
MSQAIDSNDPLLSEEALEWYSKRFPNRKLAEDKVLDLYLRVKEYAQTDPLLTAFYKANGVMV